MDCWRVCIQYLQKVRYIQKKELPQGEEQRYKQKGIDGLSDLSRRPPHTIRCRKITPEVEKTVLDLRLSRRFGCSNRIRFRLKRTVGLSLSTRTAYKMLKRHGLNIFKCQSKIIKIYKRFNMEHPNDMVQMDIIGPFYLYNSGAKSYFVSCLDDCSRKVAASKWSERKRSIDTLDVLEDWIINNGKPKTVMHDNGIVYVQSIREFS